MVKNACNQLYLDQDTLREKCPNTKFFCSAFSHVRTGYGEILLSFNIQSECGKYRPEKAPYLDTFHTVTGRQRGKIVNNKFLWLVLVSKGITQKRILVISQH